MKTSHFLRKSRLAVILSLVALLHPVRGATEEITPSMVFMQALRIEKEVDLLKRHYRVSGQNPAAEVTAELLPRHAWQKAYEIAIKISVFRRKHGLAGLAPVVHEPEVRSDPRATWEQTQRLLTELRIAKAHLGVADEASAAEPVAGKRALDVFNKLNQISYDMDILNGEAISPSDVYAEVLRLNEDVNAILRKNGTPDLEAPPVRRSDATPKDALDAAFALMGEIQRLQRQTGVEITDFAAFHKAAGVVPADTFNMVSLCVAELQPVKARLEMRHAITPPAIFQDGKTSAEVTQLLGYLAAKLRPLRLR